MRPTLDVIYAFRSSFEAGRMIKRDGKNFDVGGKSYGAFRTREDACPKRLRMFGI